MRSSARRLRPANSTTPPDVTLGTRSQGTATHLVRRDLLTPDEVMRLPAGTMLLFRQGAYPILAGKVRYFADPEFQGLFDRPDASALSPARAVPVAAE